MTTDEIKALLDKSDKAVMRAMVVLYQRQTADEQESGTTSHLNGRGFNGYDAKFGSSLAQQVMRSNSLSPRQLQYARKMARKYARQLAEVATENADRHAAEYDAAERSAIEAA